MFRLLRVAFIRMYVKEGKKSVFTTKILSLSSQIFREHSFNKT